MASKTKGNTEEKGLAVLETGQLIEYKLFDQAAAALIKENMGNQQLGPNDLSRVKIPPAGGLVWELPSIGEPEMVKEFQGILLGHRLTRVYWEKEYTGERVPPDCVSVNNLVGRGRPGGECANCPMSQWDSDPKGGGGQACKQVQVLFILKPGDLLPIIVPLPPTSVGPFKKFLTLMTMQGYPYYSCVLNFRLQSAQNKGGIKYSVIAPTIDAKLPPESLAQVKEFIGNFQEAFNKVTVEATDVSAN